jgi:hypothetical protein
MFFQRRANREAVRPATRKDSRELDPAKRPVSSEFVRWTFRVLLHREAGSNDFVNQLVAGGISEADLVLRIFRSFEFSRGVAGTQLATENWHPQDGQRTAMLAVLLADFKGYDGSGQVGFYTDFLGVRTRTQYVPGMQQYDNRVLASPTEDRPLLFETAEWEGALRSVMEAKDGLVAIELGAGWGPWLVTCHAAARQRGIRDVKLAGVEASEEHFSYMVQHLRDNGIDPEQHYLFRGVVGKVDGFAYFPRLPDAQEDWGAQAVITEGQSAERVLDNFTDYRGHTFEKMDRVPCIALTTLLRRYPRIDVLHCDIQDSEGEVLPPAMNELTERVRRVVVGTHSRKSEGALLEAFIADGWALEADKSCRYVFDKDRLVLLYDGIQVWANPRLAMQGAGGEA